ncbi:carbamoyl-phosphate synthase large subunit [Candidatus Micrarchaeota archaeon CG11_big_fil_rev_8_21_14_0_20_47_5]|nr:MAG: carbamoyl-phosphate synthase large subunit [Candidatus Micrarchaeota archaeon CG11_big_fil_rev_8_21_14_0_20_47_5]
MGECSRTIGTQMKSTGEVMAIGRSFEESLQKAVRSLEIKIPEIEEGKIEEHLTRPTDLRLFAIFEALRREWKVERIHSLTGINEWFLRKMEVIVGMERKLAQCNTLSREILFEAKQLGFSDEGIGGRCGKSEMEIRGMRKELGILPTYKMVDTCAAEFDAKTPYYYSTYESGNEVRGEGKKDGSNDYGNEDRIRGDSEKNEVGEGKEKDEGGADGKAQVREGRKKDEIKESAQKKKKVVVIGSGPIRIGQGIEFDYCCCHASFALREEGYESIMINNNPETISTDFDASDRLYFEPLTFEDVMNVIEREAPLGVIVQFGGQTAINLAEPLSKEGVRILGTQNEGIDIAEDRERFKKLLEGLGIRQPQNGTALNERDALLIANRITYPVIVRPSYVIAGRAMRVIYSDDELKKYIAESVEVSRSHPVLIDKYIERALECEIDGVSDESGLFTAGMMEHIERAGVHSGDASAVFPPVKLKKEVQEEILECSRRIALAIKNVGAINIQYIVKDDVVYVLEANPRASRTIPFLSKATGIPIAKIATKIILGRKLSEFSLPSPPKVSYYSVKSVVFPFQKLPGVDFVLGPEMKSTGETMGMDREFGIAYYKSMLAANMKMPLRGVVLISLKKEHQGEGGELARKFSSLGFFVCATEGTAKGIGNAFVLNKAGKGEPDVLSCIKSGMINLVINTPSRGKNAQTDGFKIRRASIESNIPCITNLEAAFALAEGLRAAKESKIEVRSLEEFWGK